MDYTVLTDAQVRDIRSLCSAMVFQQFNLFPNHTALKKRGARPDPERHSESSAGAGARARELLAKVGLAADKVDSYPDALAVSSSVARSPWCAGALTCFLDG